MTKLDERENESPIQDKLLSAHNNGNHNTLTLSPLQRLFSQCNLFGFSGLQTCFWLVFNNAFHIIANIFFYIEITLYWYSLLCERYLRDSTLFANSYKFNKCFYIELRVNRVVLYLCDATKRQKFSKYYFCDIIKWYEEIKIYTKIVFAFKPITLKAEIRHQIYNR